jgi:hypothetical protein
MSLEGALHNRDKTGDGYRPNLLDDMGSTVLLHAIKVQK